MLQALAEVEADGTRVAGAPDGRSWAVAAGEIVTLWRDATAAGELPPAPSSLHDLAYSPDGTALLAAPERTSTSQRDWVPLGDLKALLRSGRRLPRRIVTACWAPDGGELLAAIEDPPGGPTPAPRQQVLTLDGATRAPRAVLWEDAEWMRVEAVAHGGSRLAVGALEVRLFEAGRARPVAAVPQRGIQVRRLAFSAAGDRLAIGYADGEVTLVDPATAAVRVSWRAHSDEAAAVAFSPDGRLLATGGWDERVALWDAAGIRVADHPASGLVADVAFLGGDRLLALRAAPDVGALMLAVR